MNLRDMIRSKVRRFGWDVIRFNPSQHPLPRRGLLLENHGIDLVLDIGANAGQYGSELRRLGYRGRIVSFEPLTEAFQRLQSAARGDAGWRVINVALGASAGKHTIHLAANSESSSLLQMLPLHLDAAPHSQCTGEESVKVEVLDAMFDELCAGARSVYMKIDTQGYESHVLRGAAKSLERIDMIQIEMSLAPLYAGQALFGDLYAELTGAGFTLVGLESNFVDPRTGQLLQVDGIFSRAQA
jgi:FkbM family methyltransferase